MSKYMNSMYFNGYLVDKPIYIYIYVYVYVYIHDITICRYDSPIPPILEITEIPCILRKKYDYKFRS